MADQVPDYRNRELTQDVVDDVRQRIGIPQRGGQVANTEVVTADTIRLFALAYGDDNPLFTDAGHAASSIWNGPVGPPMMMSSASIAPATTWTPQQQAIMRGGDPLAGMGQYMCGERWVFAKPARPGMRIDRVQCLDAAELKHSEFGGGVGALVSHRIEFSDRSNGELLAIRFLDFWHAEREKSRSSGKYLTVEPHHYTQDEIADIDTLYENEQVQGSEARAWEDVQIGDSLGTIAKGPFLLTDMITYHIAVGWGGFGGGSSKVAYKNRKRIPKFYTLNEYGIPDSAQRCHWDRDWAQRLGHPAPYDYGAIRSNWMVHLITNWMGDSASLLTMSAAVLKFNYFGDAHRISGTVTDRRQTERTSEIDVAVEGINQRGEVTCKATATVLLPSKAHPSPFAPPIGSIIPPPGVVPRSRGDGE